MGRLAHPETSKQAQTDSPESSKAMDCIFVLVLGFLLISPGMITNTSANKLFSIIFCV